MDKKQIVGKGRCNIPIYEYLCPNCKKKIEIISTPTEKVICNKCGHEMKKLISAPAFRVYTK